MTGKDETAPFDVTLQRSRHPRVVSTRDIRRSEALRRKMIEPIDRGNMRANRGLTAPNSAILEQLSEETVADIRDVDHLFQLLPDTELAMQILVSSILSPKDLLACELNYSIDGNRFTSELTGQLLKPIKDHFDNEHKIIEVLPKWLEDALFKTGSYATAILPESSIDDAINSDTEATMESLRDSIDPATKRLHSINLLGNPLPKVDNGAPVFGFENFTNNWTYSVTGIEGMNLDVIDNFEILKLPILRDKMRTDKVQKLLHRRKLSMESYDNTNNTSVYRQRHYRFTPVITLRNVKNSKKKNFGHPLAIHLPSEAVIPVHTPGNPEQHLGYFILLDEYGNPLSKKDSVDFYQEYGASISSNANNGAAQNMSASINRLHASMFGAHSENKEQKRELERMYIDIIEQELLQRLRAGVYGDEVEISRDPEVYRIMFARACRNMRAQLLFIPSDLMIYCAFDYNDYGIGQSLMSKSKILAGIRAMLLLADTKASLKNSIGRTQINITLDEKDPDPAKTVEFALHEYAKVNAGSFPLGVGNPQDLLNYLQRASIDVNVEGNLKYPGTKFDVDDVQSNKTRPDQELQTELRKRHIQSFGLSPETVDASNGPEFATSIVANNLLMAKRIMTYGQQTSSFITRYIQTYVLNSQTLMDELREILESNWKKLNPDQKEKRDQSQVVSKQVSQQIEELKDEVPGEESLKQAYLKEKIDYLKNRIDNGGWDVVLTDFITSLQVKLPLPDSGALQQQATALDGYITVLEKALDAYIGENYITDNTVGSELSSYAKEIKEALKAYYIRRYMRDNNILPELDELTTFNEEDGPAIDLLQIQQQHLEGIARSVLKYAQAFSAMKTNQSSAVSKLNNAGADTVADNASGEADDINLDDSDPFSSTDSTETNGSVTDNQ